MWFGWVRRLPIASTAPLGKITAVPWVDFVKGQRKDDLMQQHLARFSGAEGVLFIGRAQEKTALFRTERRRDANGESYPWVVKTTGVVNHFYVYAVDADFGPFFLKFCSCFPTMPSCALMATSGPSGRPLRPGSGTASCAPQRATTNTPSASSLRRPDSPHEPRLDSIKPTSSALVNQTLIFRGDVSFADRTSS